MRRARVVVFGSLVLLVMVSLPTPASSDVGCCLGIQTCVNVADQAHCTASGGYRTLPSACDNLPPCVDTNYKPGAECDSRCVGPNGPCTGDPDCDDGNPCTDDTCSPVDFRCQHAPNTGALCDDANRCTINDSCDDGVCAGTDSCHFECYETTSHHIRPIEGIDLIDQFGSTTVSLDRILRLCTPVDKNGENPGAEAASTHLMAYRSKPTTPFTPVRKLRVVNQFGTLIVDAVRLSRLLVPTTKSLSSPPPPPSSASGALIDHFECYSIHRSPGSPRFTPRQASLVDQFGSLTVSVRHPKFLCNPVDKNGESPGAESDPLHLVCYSIKASTQSQLSRVPILVNNQFGPETIGVDRRAELCVPSTKGLCGNGVLDPGEQCDPGDPDVSPAVAPSDGVCPGQCLPPALVNGDPECVCCGDPTPVPASHRPRQRPVQGGWSLTNYEQFAVAQVNSAGTLGAIVSIGNQRYVMSNNHVIARQSDGDFGTADGAGIFEAQARERITQPGTLDNGVVGDTVAGLTAYEPLCMEGAGCPNDSNFCNVQPNCVLPAAACAPGDLNAGAACGPPGPGGGCVAPGPSPGTCLPNNCIDAAIGGLFVCAAGNVNAGAPCAPPGPGGGCDLNASGDGLGTCATVGVALSVLDIGNNPFGGPIGPTNCIAQDPNFTISLAALMHRVVHKSGRTTGRTCGRIAGFQDTTTSYSGGICAGGNNAGGLCLTAADCPMGACAIGTCAGGANNGLPCTDGAGCPGGTCRGSAGNTGWGHAPFVNQLRIEPLSKVCRGGANEGTRCATDANCGAPPAACIRAFELPGDSGSVVFTLKGSQAVGLVYAGTAPTCSGGANDGNGCVRDTDCPGGKCGKSTFANPIQPVLQRFGVRF
jgi:hypothetical protein